MPTTLRDFWGINLARESVPDATTLMGFRHLLEANKLPQAIPKKVNNLLGERGLLMNQGTLIDASSSTNKTHARCQLLHGEETRVGADAGYVGVSKR